MERVAKLAAHLRQRGAGPGEDDADDGMSRMTEARAGVERRDTNAEARTLEGKCAVVTGAASGIGKATALRFAEQGAKVVCADLNEDQAKATADEINEAFPGSAVAVKADVSSTEDTKRVVQTCVDTFGKINVFYANAGILPKFVPIADETESSFMRTMEINTLSVFLAIKYAGEAMKACGEPGSIICTASIAALRSDLTPLQYAASKGAILSMIKSANDRLLLDDIRVNAVVPGGVMTPLVMEVAKNLDEQGLFLKGYDYRRFPPIPPEEIAQTVAFLASDHSAPIK
ncbi:Short-chain dehydrogenase reductase 3b (AtSDR3b), partial [Durusdinium trenchii]